SPPSTSTRIFTEEIGDRTNNEAEYLALLRFLKLLNSRITMRQDSSESYEDILVYSDSEVMVRQLSGEYKVKEERLQRLWREAKALMKEIGVVRLEHVSREENLAGLWLEGRIKAAQMEPEEFISDL